MFKRNFVLFKKFCFIFSRCKVHVLYLQTIEIEVKEFCSMCRVSRLLFVASCRQWRRPCRCPRTPKALYLRIFFSAKHSGHFCNFLLFMKHIADTFCPPPPAQLYRSMHDFTFLILSLYIARRFPARDQHTRPDIVLYRVGACIGSGKIKADKQRTTHAVFCRGGG